MEARVGFWNPEVDILARGRFWGPEKDSFAEEWFCGEDSGNPSCPNEFYGPQEPYGASDGRKPFWGVPLKILVYARGDLEENVDSLL